MSPTRRCRGGARRKRSATRSACPPRRFLGPHAQLRPYQRAGFDWLAFLWQHRLGGILADDMGLGKTLQILALSPMPGGRRATTVPRGRAHLGAVDWRTEAARFAPGLRVGSSAPRAPRAAFDAADVAASADLVVTSYAVLRLDEQELAAVEWAALVLDEAQFVKNRGSQTHRAARSVRADVTLALTGTPLENTLDELWAILSLIAPGLFASARRFREEYVGPVEQGKVPENHRRRRVSRRRLARLRRRIRPFLLRRTKEVVAPELPGEAGAGAQGQPDAPASRALRPLPAAGAAEGARPGRGSRPSSLHRVPLADAAAHAQPRPVARRPGVRAHRAEPSSTRCSSSSTR